MMPRNKTLRRTVARIIVTTAIDLSVAGYVVFRFAHSQSPHARSHEIFWLVLCGAWLVKDLVNFLRRNERNPFEDEMAHRRSLVRDEYHAQIKG